MAHDDPATHRVIHQLLAEEVRETFGSHDHVGRATSPSGSPVICWQNGVYFWCAWGPDGHQYETCRAPGRVTHEETLERIEYLAFEAHDRFNPSSS